MFKNIEEKLLSSYDSLEDDIINDFYNPILENAKSYKRVSCYFSSKSLSMYSSGLDRFCENGGYLQLLISLDISYDDFNEIELGYKLRNDEMYLTEKEIASLGNLAYMISLGKADVKFGFVENGLFHSKWGIFTDENLDSIYFIGSNNETARAIERNYESFDLDFSWDSSKHVKEKIKKKREKFDNVWQGLDKNITCINGNEILYESIKKYNTGQINKMNIFNSALILEMDNNNQFYFIDNTSSKILSKSSFKSKLTYYISDLKGYPYLKEDINYKEIEKLIQKVKKQVERNNEQFEISKNVIDFINSQRYSIDEFRKSGLTLKNGKKNWEEEFENFVSIVNFEVDRPLLPKQLDAAFYMLVQKRAANFSVPGSGKTSMLLGVFAYLNSFQVGQPIERILVICPKNAFDPWRIEFKNVFGNKKELKCNSTENINQRNELENIWFNSNLILINYESLPKYEGTLVKLLKNDSHTMLVFDEVHRVKGVESKRGVAALNVSMFTEYKYVLTGTPIPNSYLDIYNFLHILFNNEYESHFAFDKKKLINPNKNDVSIINEKLSPYFWRINKDDLNVPPAEEDILIKVLPSNEQLQIAEEIYLNAKNPLATIIRMIQLSTNPKLLSKKISFNELGYSNEEDSENNVYNKSALTLLSNSLDDKFEQYAKKYKLNKVKSTKFEKGIELVVNLVKKGEKVVIWGLFVDTLLLINSELQNVGICSDVVYGAVDTDSRKKIINKFLQHDMELPVLISNPNTLGESVSLHSVAHNAVYFEFNYNLTFMLQSRDRIHRLGLKESDKTKYYYLITESNLDYYNFIDQKIYDRLVYKEKIMKEAIDGEFLIPEFQDDEIQVMKDIIESERKY